MSRGRGRRRGGAIKTVEDLDRAGGIRETGGAENRRKLLKKLKPRARGFAAREFAKLGLYQ